MSRHERRAKQSRTRKIQNQAGVNVNNGVPAVSVQHARMIRELATKLKEHGPLRVSVPIELTEMLEVGWLFHLSGVNKETGEIEFLSAIAPKG